MGEFFLFRGSVVTTGVMLKLNKCSIHQKNRAIIRAPPVCVVVVCISAVFLV